VYKVDSLLFYKWVIGFFEFLRDYKKSL